MFCMQRRDDNEVFGPICVESMPILQLGKPSGKDSGANQEGFSVKIARTFTIDVWIARELQNKKNQSKFVNDAIKDKLNGSLAEINLTWRQLAIHMKNHPETDRTLCDLLTRLLYSAD